MIQTLVKAHKLLRENGLLMAKLEYATFTRPLPGQDCCGDMPFIRQFDDKILLCLMDVAGHGHSAQIHAENCINLLNDHYKENLDNLILLLDEFSHGKKGLVVGFALIAVNAGLIEYMGVGNIRARIIGRHQVYNFVSRPGVLGSFQHLHLTSQRYLLNDQDILLIYSDGITDRFGRADYDKLIEDDINHIPKNLIEFFGKNIDDASCIAARYYK